jgi:Eukaryotic aspartyl protease.
MEDSDRAFWKQMYKAGAISSKAFALCYSHGDIIYRNGTDAGVITLGGSNPKLHQSPMVYAQYVQMDGWYGVHVSAMYLKSNKDHDKVIQLDLNIKELNSEGIIVDSGTTDSIFPSMVYKPFQKAFKELLGYDFMERVPMKKHDDDIHPPRDYPIILIQLKAAHKVQDHELVDEKGHPLPGLAKDLDKNAPNDVILEILPEYYMTWSESSKKYKNRFRMDDDDGDGIIGANGMIGHDVLLMW